MDVLDYNIVVTSRVKDRGQITWPASQVDQTDIEKVGDDACSLRREVRAAHDR